MQLPFQNTSIYRHALILMDEISALLQQNEGLILKKKMEEESIAAITNIAKGLSADAKNLSLDHFQTANENIYSIIALLDVALNSNIINNSDKQRFQSRLKTLETEIKDFHSKRKKILILSAEVGQGHMSASKAVKEAMEYKYGYDYDVEIVDFVQMLSSIINVVTKKNYENLVKFAPSIYKFIYESTNKQVQIVKLLNQFNYPFVISKIRKFFEEKDPDILVSTFPVWNYLAAEIWKKQRKDAKFISIVTDSITIHHSWVIANTDYHIVANQDTAESLEKLGTPEKNIKILGFPVRLSFMQNSDRQTLLKDLDLNPQNFTILFLPTSQNLRKNQYIIKELVNSNDPFNVVIITGRDVKLKPRLEKMDLGKNIRILGWTEKMCDFIKISDLIITKAGGATIMECIAAEKPMIITSIIPGQEEGNAELIKKHHLGIIATGPKDNIMEHVNYIRQKMDYFKKNLHETANPQAAIKIAEFLHELLI